MTPARIPLPEAVLSVSKPPFVLIAPEALPLILPPLAFSVTFSTLEDELIAALTMMLLSAVRVNNAGVMDVFAIGELTVMLPAPDPAAPALVVVTVTLVPRLSAPTMVEAMTVVELETFELGA